MLNYFSNIIPLGSEKNSHYILPMGIHVPSKTGGLTTYKASAKEEDDDNADLVCVSTCHMDLL